MTAPKSPLPGQFVELTRRTSHRRYFLRPDKDCCNLAGYMYGKALLDCEQQACVANCMSTHYHAAQLDKSGRRSEFMQRFHSNTARKRNLQIRHRENLWAPGAPGDLAVLEMEDIVRKVVYVCLQPVAAGCVEKCSDWNGFKILPRDWGKPMTFHRPSDCGEDMPETVTFIPMPPPGFEHLPLEEVKAFFEDLIEQEEKRYAKKRRFPVLGMAYCEAISPFYTPKSSAPMRTLNPKFACRNKLKLIRALRRQRQFRQEHRDALVRLREGERDVVFPAGTLQMRRLAGVECDDPPEHDPRITCLQWSEALQAKWDAWRSIHRAV